MCLVNDYILSILKWDLFLPFYLITEIFELRKKWLDEKGQICSTKNNTDVQLRSISPIPCDHYKIEVNKNNLKIYL